MVFSLHSKDLILQYMGFGCQLKARHSLIIPLCTEYGILRIRTETVVVEHFLRIRAKPRVSTSHLLRYKQQRHSSTTLLYPKETTFNAAIPSSIMSPRSRKKNSPVLRRGSGKYKDGSLRNMFVSAQDQTLGGAMGSPGNRSVPGRVTMLLLDLP